MVSESLLSGAKLSLILKIEIIFQIHLFCFSDQTARVVISHLL